MLVLGGRAPQARWGQGSLQELDHVPFVAPLTKFAATSASTDGDPGAHRRGAVGGRRAARRPGVRRPTRSTTSSARAPTRMRRPRCRMPRAGPLADDEALARATALLRDARRPVIMAGTDLYWGHAEGRAARARRGAADPGLPQRARARVPARRPRAVLLARAPRGAGRGGRRARRRRADGLPARLRRRVRRRRRRSIVVDRVCPDRAHPREICAELYGGISATLRALAGAGGGPDRSPWLERLRAAERAARDGERAERARRPRSAASDARLRRARRAARPRCDRHRRRRGLRVLRRAGHRLLRAGLLAGPRTVRVPRLGARLRAGGEARASRPSRSSCCSATGRSASAGWSSTRWRATASASSGSSATTGSGGSRSTRWR